MFIVVILVSILNADSSSASTTINTIATMPYTGTTSDSFWDKLKGALLNSFFFVAIVPVVTFDLVLLFYLRCTQFLKLYMGLFFYSFGIHWWLWDSVAKRRFSRERRNLGNGSQENLNFASVLDSSLTIGTVDVGHQTTRLVRAEEGQVMERNAELSAPLIDHRGGVQLHGQGDTVLSESLLLEDIGLGSTGAIKLGLGDFVFYSVLVGRAAMYDFMTAYACYLAIIAALGITLMLLAFYEKALPALPVSIVLGVLFYFLTRLLLEAFVVKCSLSLVMF
ncbi:hypothetical protein GH714_043857 [Hevea brasiliensis]|uniref:Presenilin n=1 Tax=Hevea brasiliensis TaxID=3981 RepID=A0A6A6K2D6_HEVBR|nr:hypothetical protein GH714_043857 [Hevea brasiliensis]